MSTLTNTQISNTYQGLLKLADSSTGITTSLQSVQDGLGNDTGLKIAENRLEGGNLFNIYNPGIAQYYGNGIASSAANPGANSQNIMNTFLFYDNGIHSYSAITVNCGVLEAGTSVDIAFYNSQLLDTYGYVPYQQLSAEVNIDTTSTGLKTVTFSSPLSFSGTGPGFYWSAIRYNTSGTPVLRLTTPSLNTQGYNGGIVQGTLGFVFNTAGTATTTSFRTSAIIGATQGAIYNTASFPATWTSTELDTLTSTTAVNFGFILHTIR